MAKIKELNELTSEVFPTLKVHSLILLYTEHHAEPMGDSERTLVSEFTICLMKGLGAPIALF
jgi:hypothetical protein